MRFAIFVFVLQLFVLFQTQVAVDQLWSDDDEVTSVGPGENVKIKLKVRTKDT